MSRNSPEDQLVARIARGFPGGLGSGVRLGTGDDAALWRPRPGFETILTSDWFLEGAHFLRDLHPPDSVGWKCLARAASDIAAMGGTPRCFLLNLAFPFTSTGKWLDGFLGGLRRAAKRVGCVMAGGDTTRQDHILINLTVVGEVRKDRAVLRSSAQPGDLLFVSGRLGEAELGLQELRQSKAAARRKSPAIRKHMYPEPRIELGCWLGENGFASAMMDISDGLSTDLARMCKASGVGAVISEAALPGPAGVLLKQMTELALHGGDDYELLFTVPVRQLERFKRNMGGRSAACVGTITSRKRLLLSKRNGKAVELTPAGWDPFQKG